MAGTQRGRRSKGSSQIRSSEAEAIDQALDILLFREELIAGVAAIGGKGGVVDAYEDDQEPRGTSFPKENLPTQ